MERVEVESCSHATVLRKTYVGHALVRAEVLHHGKRKGWRLCPYRYDPKDSLAYMSSDGLAAYIHAHGEVSFYDAWSDGARSSKKISREAWVEECLADMRRDAAHLKPRSKDALSLEELKRAYASLQRELDIAWRNERYAAHREDAARAYVLENALVLATSRFDPSDPKGPRLADMRFVRSFGLWAILAFQTRTGHFDEAEKLLASELEDEQRMQLRLEAQRAQTEVALVAALGVFTENPERAAMKRAQPVVRGIRKLVGEPQTEALARALASFG